MSELYQRYVGQLSSVCYRYVPSESDAKDVLQNSFIKIFTSLQTFVYVDEPSFDGWMVRIVVNEALHFLKEQKRLQMVPISEADESDLDDEEPEPELISADELHQLIGMLPDGYRTVINLFVFEGYSHNRIAKLLGIGESTSATQFFYAKRLLARKIKERLIDKEKK